MAKQTKAKAPTKKVPEFILKGDDEFAAEALARYRNECINGGCAKKYIADVDKKLTEFKKFKGVKKPG